MGPPRLVNPEMFGAITLPGSRGSAAAATLLFPPSSVPSRFTTDDSSAVGPARIDPFSTESVCTVIEFEEVEFVHTSALFPLVEYGPVVELYESTVAIGASSGSPPDPITTVLRKKFPPRNSSPPPVGPIVAVNVNCRLFANPVDVSTTGWW